VPVTSDLDIYRTAKRLIGEHGEQTPSMVATMIREFTDLDDPEAVAVWKRIREAVEELLVQGATVH
jgi:hypothetical protein